MNSRLDRIETRLQAFIENSLAALLPWSSSQRMLARQMIEAIQDQLLAEPDGSLLAPGLFLVKVNPDRLANWQANPGVLESLAQTLQTAGQESGVTFAAFPEIRVVPDAALGMQEVHIHAVRHTAPLSDTAVMDVEPAYRPDSHGHFPRNAFLIVNGSQVFTLEQPVISIGRRLDNQLVVDDPRVSRAHAQLRVVNGEFVLFDLNSSGGTFLNGTRITSAVLHPGDVISLAGVPIIYGQETGPLDHSRLDETRSLPASGSEPDAPR